MVINQNKTAPRNADLKSIISKPFTITAASHKTNEFITKVKSPIVRILTGNVRINNIGLTRAFKIPKTSADKSAIQKLVTNMPGIK